MRILLIRHGDPDYVNDTLTEKGRRGGTACKTCSIYEYGGML